jgi:serine/threonine protein kinase
MGAVYRARDTRLNRDVAIKTLPDTFAHDADRVARVTREAQTLAALNHPNIAQIYGVEGHALVMELVDGEDLAAVVARSPAGLPIADALAIARQIADALEGAHDQGLVHRDLKPANVKVRADGTVKVLDFGLAKALDQSAGVSGHAGSATNSPTVTAAAFAGAPGTQIGMILGTAAYMAPEQARGKSVDRRADIWAFGVVLFEMLTGRRVFQGDEVSDVLAAVLRQEIDLTALPASTPTSVRRLLRRCLERDPRRRLSAIGDARLDIDEPDAPAPAAGAIATPAPPSLISRLWPALAGVVVTAIAAYLLWLSGSSSDASGRLARLSILPPPGKQLVADSTAVALSPDGTMVAFVTGTQSRGDDNELWVRSLESNTARQLDDAVGVVLPFWSPDSRRIAYSAAVGNKLKTIAATGGRADVVAEVLPSRGGVWTASNVILFSQAGGPLLKVPATGGTPVPATTLDPERKEFGHRFPTLLPDGDRFLYIALPGREGKFDVFAGSLADPSPKARVLVGALDAAPVYAEPGYLLYNRQGVLAALPFDAKTLKITGDPILLVDEPAHVLDPKIAYTGGRSVTVSADGSLAYYAAASNRTVATWYDAAGVPSGGLDLPAAFYDSVAISPDGSRAAVSRATSSAASSLWLVDLKRGTSTQLSTGRGRNDSPVWSPDGSRLVFASDRSGLQQFFVKNVDEAGPETEFFTSEVMFKSPMSFTPDGTSIVMNSLNQTTLQDLSLLAASGRTPPVTLVAGPSRDIGGRVSPDERWLAYASEAGGSLQIWVQPFPGPGRPVQVSEQGGLFVWWTPDAKQLIWTTGDFRALWRADVVPGTTFSTGRPVKMATLPPGIVWIDAMPDRKRFLAVAPATSGTGAVTIVQNWRRALDGK